MHGFKTKLTALGLAAVMTCSVAGCAVNSAVPETPSEASESETTEEPTTTTTEETTTEATTTAETEPSYVPMLGSWEVSSDTDVNPDMFDKFNTAVTNTNDMWLCPRFYLASQSVSGTKHCYLATANMTMDDGTKDTFWVLVYIYEDPDGNCSLLDTSLLKWNYEPTSSGFVSQGEFPEDISPNAYMGIPDDYKAKPYKSMIKEALAECDLEMDLDVEAYIGCAVQGANYTFLTKETDDDGNSCWGLLVCDSTDGSTKYIGFYPFEIGV